LIFDKLKAILGLGNRESAQSDEPVILVERNNEILFHEKSTQEIPPQEDKIHSLDEPFDRVFRQFIDEYSSSHAILFDPEEEECFIYFYDEDGMKSHARISRDIWKSRIEYLKSLNGSNVMIGETLYHVALIISFSNFGERISVLFHLPEGDYKAYLKEETKKYIKILNRLKPSTSLTNLNRTHLIEFIRRYRDQAESDLFAMLEKSSLLEGPEKERCLAKSRETGAPPDETAVSIGVYPRKKLAELVAQWIGASYVDIEEEDVDTEVLMQAGLEFCTTFRVIPYRITDTEVICAAVDPLDERVKKAVEEKFEKKAELHLSAEEDIRALAEDLFRDQDGN